MLSHRKLVALIGTVAFLGCGSSSDQSRPVQADTIQADTLSQAQRDSAVARSGLPGARGVSRAQDISATAKERAAQMDSIE
jgi:hypothetical protein